MHAGQLHGCMTMAVPSSRLLDDAQNGVDSLVLERTKRSESAQIGRAEPLEGIVAFRASSRPSCRVQFDVQDCWRYSGSPSGSLRILLKNLCFDQSSQADGP